MDVSNLLKSLSYGELSNLSLSNEGSGEIVQDKLPKLIGYINDGLLRLYSKFTLSEKEIVIAMVEGRTDYPLRLEYTQSQGTSSTKYILDAQDPFEADIIKVLAVNSTCGYELRLNDDHSCWSVFTPTPTLLQVPEPMRFQALSLLYQAKHPVLEPDNLDEEILLPEVLFEALKAYVASKTYSHMNGVENAAKGIEYMGIFDLICAEAIQNDVLNTSISNTNTKFEKGGWV